MDSKCVNVQVKPHNWKGEQMTDEALVVSVLRKHPGMSAKWYIDYLVSSYGMPRNTAKILVQYIGGM